MAKCIEDSETVVGMQVRGVNADRREGDGDSKHGSDEHRGTEIRERRSVTHSRSLERREDRPPENRRGDEEHQMLENVYGLARQSRVIEPRQMPDAQRRHREGPRNQWTSK